MKNYRVETPDEVFADVGKELAISDWLDVTQKMIDGFADVTGDHQWIHVDPERAARESPFGATVAHGFLTLSLVPVLRSNCLWIGGARMSVNYGLNRVRFAAPVKAGSRVRGRFTLRSCDAIAGGIQLVIDAVIEIEGENKPACIAETVSRLYV